MKILGTALAAALGLATAAQADTLVMQSIYPSTLPLLGDTGVTLTEQVKQLTGGELDFFVRGYEK